MYGRKIKLLALGLAGVLGLAGCCCCRRQQCCSTIRPAPNCAPPIMTQVPPLAPGIVAGPAGPTAPGFPSQPVVPSIPAAPSNPLVPADPVPVVPPAQPMPADPGLQPARSFEPSQTDARVPADPPRDPVQLQAPYVQPAPIQPEQSAQPEVPKPLPQAPLQPLKPLPQPPRQPQQPASPPVQTPEPPAAVNPPPAVAEKREQPLAPPLDIPGFALAKTKVATGLKPFPDGIAWLKANGYRTALHVRAPGEDDKAAQDLFRKNGLDYQTLEIAPGTLNKEAVETFNRCVTDQGKYPLFVFDKDGAMTGALWMLHFRLSEGVSEEKARLEAGRLGWKPEQDPAHKAMAEAVARYLQGQNP